MAEDPSLNISPLDRVLGFIRVLEAGGGAAEIRPFLADTFVLVEAPHLLAPEGSSRTLASVLAGAASGAVESQAPSVRMKASNSGMRRIKSGPEERA